MRVATRFNSISNVKPDITQMIDNIPDKEINKMVKESKKIDKDKQERRIKLINTIFKPDEEGITYKEQKITYKNLFTKGGPNEEFFVWGLCYAITQTAYLYKMARWSPDYKKEHHEIINDLASEELLALGSTMFYQILNKYRNSISQNEKVYTSKLLHEMQEYTNSNYPEIDEIVKKIDNGKSFKEDCYEIGALSLFYGITPDMYFNCDFIMFDLWTIYINDKKKFFTMTLELSSHILLTMCRQYNDFQNLGTLVLPKRLNQKLITSKCDTEKDVTYTNLADFYFTSAIRYYAFLDEEFKVYNKEDNYFLGQDLIYGDIKRDDVYNFARRSYTRCLGTDEMSNAIKNNDIIAMTKYMCSFHCNAQIRLNKYSPGETNNIEQNVEYATYTHLQYYVNDDKYIIDDYVFIRGCVEFKLTMMTDYYYYNLLASQRLKQKSENTELKASIAKLNNELVALQRKNDLLIKNKDNNLTVDSEQLATYKKQNENLSNIISEKNDQIDLLTKEIEGLRKQNELLQQDIDSLLENDDCEEQFDLEIVSSQEDKIDFINQHNIVIIGGRYDLDVKLNKLGFTNYTQADTTSELKKNVLNPDVVIICSKFVSHSMEYTANSYYKDVPKMYFNQTNIDAFINQIYEFLNNKNEINIA